VLCDWMDFEENDQKQTLIQNVNTVRYCMQINQLIILHMT